MADINTNGHTNGHVHTPHENPELAQMRSRYTPETWNQFLDVAHNALMVRRDFMKSLTDPRRDLEDSCGYPRLTEDVSIDLYKQLYDRDAIASRIVELLPMESWQVQPTVYETEDPTDVTEFEEAWDALGNDLGSGGNTWFEREEGSILWDYLRRADVLSGIGKFGVIFLGIDDGRNPQDPADGVAIINRRVEPITKRIPIRNSDGEVIGDREVRVGAKVINEYADYNPFVYDSPMTENEEKTLRSLKNLTDYELATINQWKREREEMIRNAKKKKSDVDLTDPTQRLSTIQRSTSTGGSQEVTGTEQQYLSGLGMPPPSAFASLSGTDQQYYGVQFGPSEVPDTKPSKKEHKLLFIRCFDESLIQVVRYEWNIRNPRFGMPVMYRITLNDPREQHSGVGLPMATIFVHWSRLIHIADLAYSAGSSEIFAKPRQQQVLNNILGIRKLSCGSPEMYWRGAFPGLALSTHPQLGGDVEVDRAAVRDSMENYFNDLQRYLLLTGMSAQTLSPTVVDPSPHIDQQIQLICIKMGVPKRVFMGSERGELASSQDDSQWNDVKRARQNFYLTPRMIVPFVDRCIQLGLLPAPDNYSVKWPDLEALGDAAKAAIALQQMQTLQTYVSGNVGSILATKNLWTDFLNKDEEEAEELLQAAQEQQTQMQQQQMDQQQQGLQDGSQFGGPPQSPEDQQELEKMGNDFGGKPEGGEEGEEGAGPNPPGNPPGSSPKGQPPPKPGSPPDEGEKPSGDEEEEPAEGEEEPESEPEEDDKEETPPPKGKKKFPPTKNAYALREEWESDADTEATINRFCATGKGGGIDATCGKDEGNIQSGELKGTTEHEGKTFKGTGTQDNPIHVGSDTDAGLKLLGQGKHIQLDEVKHLGELVTKIGEANKQAQSEGKTPLHYDMCKASVGGKGFCEENIGTPRSEMPQMRGFPVPGTLAATKTPNKAGKVDLSREFIDHLQDQGVKVHQDEIRASKLKASQSEIVGSRVNELVEKAEAGEDLRKRPIFVTKDGYVLDGHHHWAAIVAYGAKKGKDYKIPVHVLDMPIKDAIKVANDFAKKSGIAPKSGSSPAKNEYHEFAIQFLTNRQYDLEDNMPQTANRESIDDYLIRTMKRKILRNAIQHFEETGEILTNAFCPTGIGGGQDNSCSPHGGGEASEGEHAIANEPTTPPPPGKAFTPNVEVDRNGDGITDAARIGVPAMTVPPPPSLPRLANLTPHERAVEHAFIDAYEKDPDGVAAAFRNDAVRVGKDKGEPPTFGTDDAKIMSHAWSANDMKEQSENRATLNCMLHQTANAICKRAFLQHLDQLSPGDSVMVTVGGCGAGKGFSLGKNPEVVAMKNASKAVWDSAGDQNATENPWIQRECEKRGLKATYVYVHADPKKAWNNPEEKRGVIIRAADPKDGRMVDAQVFADSYAIGAKNHDAFHKANMNNPSAKFVFLTNPPGPPLDGVPKEALNIDRHELAKFAHDEVQKSNAPEHVKRGATIGKRIFKDNP